MPKNKANKQSQSLTTLEKRATKVPLTNAEKIPKTFIVACVSVALLVVGWYTGVNGYTIATIQCGHAPVVGRDFFGQSTYQLPEDKGYGPGPGPFDKYFCSEKEAKNAAFSRQLDPSTKRPPIR
jgi:hypothetical protein